MRAPEISSPTQARARCFLSSKARLEIRAQRCGKNSITREPELATQARPKIRAQGGKLPAGFSTCLDLETQRICDDEDHIK